MARKPDPNLRAAWAARIEAQSRSGLTVSQYCEVNNFTVGSFHSWKRRLTPNDPKPDANNPNQLTPVRILQPYDSPKPVTLRFQCGATMELSSDCVGEVIEQILKAERKLSEVASC